MLHQIRSCIICTVMKEAIPAKYFGEGGYCHEPGPYKGLDFLAAGLEHTGRGVVLEGPQHTARFYKVDVATMLNALLHAERDYAPVAFEQCLWRISRPNVVVIRGQGETHTRSLTYREVEAFRKTGVLGQHFVLQGPVPPGRRSLHRADRCYICKVINDWLVDWGDFTIDGTWRYPGVGVGMSFCAVMLLLAKKPSMELRSGEYVVSIYRLKPRDVLNTIYHAYLAFGEAVARGCTALITLPNVVLAISEDGWWGEDWLSDCRLQQDYGDCERLKEPGAGGCLRQRLWKMMCESAAS